MPENKNYSSAETRNLVRNIRRGGEEGQKAIEKIYKDYRYMIYLKQVASEYNLPASEVSDFFHDAIIIFRRNVRKNNQDNSINIQNYLTNIVKNLIQNRKRSKQHVEIPRELNTPNVLEESVAEYYTRKESKEHVNELLAQLSVKCRRLLMLWKDDYSYEEIAKLLGLKNRGAARKKKYTCMKKLTDYLDLFPHLKAFL